MAADEGVLYSAFGLPYLREAQESARSLRRVSPGIAIAVICDSASAASPPPELEAWFVALLRGAATQFASGQSSSALAAWQAGTCTKISAAMQSPFARTLLLDCDTIVLGDLRPIFRLLPRFDAAAAFCTPWAAGQCTAEYLSISEAPLVFPEYNTGVLLLHTGAPAVQRLLETWREVTERLNAAGALSSDQQAFREAAWLCDDLKLTTLKQNWNSWGSSDHMPIVIAHKGLNKGDKALSRGAGRLIGALRPSEAWARLVAAASSAHQCDSPQQQRQPIEALLTAERELLALRGWRNSPIGRVVGCVVWLCRVVWLCLVMLGVAPPPPLTADRDDVNAVAFVLKVRLAWMRRGHDESEKGVRGLWKLLVDSHGDTPLLV